jgi:hypothetical protein
LTKKFVRLYKNRQQKLASDKKNVYLKKNMKSNKYGEKPTYKPKTLQKSSKLAEQRYPSRSMINVEDRLMRQKLDYDTKHKEQKIQKEKEEEN